MSKYIVFGYPLTNKQREILHRLGFTEEVGRYERIPLGRKYIIELLARIKDTARVIVVTSVPQAVIYRYWELAFKQGWDFDFYLFESINVDCAMPHDIHVEKQGRRICRKTTGIKRLLCFESSWERYSEKVEG